MCDKMLCAEKKLMALSPHIPPKLNPDVDGKALDKALEQLEGQKQALDQFAIVAETDAQGRITYVNDQFCKISQYSREELLGKDHRHVVNSGYHPKSFWKDMWATIGQGRTWRGDVKNRTKDGAIYWVDTTIVPFLNTEGKPYKYLAIRAVITERKRAEAEILQLNADLEKRVAERTEQLEASNDKLKKEIAERQRAQDRLEVTNVELGVQIHNAQAANRQKSEFLANMSHELRTPLNSVIGFAELIHNAKVGPVSDPQKEYLGDILTSARHLLRLINDILDLAKVEAGKIIFEPEPVELTFLAGEVRDTLRDMADRKSISIAIKIDSNVDAVCTDSQKLKQVLYNYLSNALKFTQDAGQVTLEIGPEDADFFRLSVRDTGIGIKPDDIGRLFMEFQQLDASSSKKYQGTGLGLALTKRIVEAQGGKVGVESVMGKGSVFYAVLPRRQKAEEAHGP